MRENNLTELDCLFVCRFPIVCRRSWILVMMNTRVARDRVREGVCAFGKRPGETRTALCGEANLAADEALITGAFSPLIELGAGKFRDLSG
jgi:hypothetical protein